MSLIPYEVGRFSYVPGTRPYLFRLVLSSEALRAVGVLEKIIRIFAENGISLLQLKVSASSGGKLSIVLIADFKGREHLLEHVSRELSKVEFVESVRVIPPVVEGVVVDALSFPLTLMGQRVVIYRRAVYEGFIKSGWSRFGSAYGVLLYLAGFEAGRLAYRDHAQLVRDPLAQVRLAEALFQMLGYGILRVVRLDDERREAVARVYESFECELFKGAGEIRGSFVRGLIAGWLAERWGVKEEDILAREVKCIARGDPYCEYNIRVEGGK